MLRASTMVLGIFGATVMSSIAAYAQHLSVLRALARFVATGIVVVPLLYALTIVLYGSQGCLS